MGTMKAKILVGIIVIGCVYLTSACSAAAPQPTAVSTPTTDPFKADRPTPIVPTPRNGPTITASGPLLNSDAQTRSNMFHNGPKTVGGMDLVGIDVSNSDNPVELELKNTDGSTYDLEVEFLPSVQA